MRLIRKQTGALIAILLLSGWLSVLGWQMVNPGRARVRAENTSTGSDRESPGGLPGAAAAVAVSLPNATGATGTNVTIPITVGDLTGQGVIAYDFVVIFNQAVLQAPEVDKTGTLSSGLNITPNTATPGRITVSAFGTTPLAGAGTLLNLKFNVAGAAGGTTALTWQSFSFNEGDPAATTVNGSFTVPGAGNPVPTLTSLNPNAVAAGGAAFTLTLNGTNFVNGSTVQFNGANRTTNFVSATELTANITAADIATAGTPQLTVVNPAPGGGTSNALALTINNPAPTLTSLNPNAVGAGGAAFTLTLNGTNFTNSSVVQLNGSNRPTNFVSGTQLTVNITAGDIATAGTASVTVNNPAPGGGTSNALSLNIISRIVRVAPATTVAGGVASVPIELVAQGDEAALGFSLSFDPAVLSNPQASLGSDAAGALLNSNDSQAAAGRFGILLALPAGQKFAAGTRQLAVVNFAVAAGAATSTTIGFGDQPLAREVVDTNANTLSAAFVPGTLTFSSGFEADVAPRPNGDGRVALSDWVQIGRFIAGLDPTTSASEFQRADCAPKSTLGDGRLTLGDWVQAGRYAAGLDPVSAVGGPISPASATLAAMRNAGQSEALTSATNQVRAVAAAFAPDDAHALRITLDAQGSESALGFSVSFDPARWQFVSAAAGPDAASASLIVNLSQAESGRIGIALALPAGQALTAGWRQMAVVKFAPLSGSGSSTISFGDQPVARELVDRQASALPASFAGTDANRLRVAVNVSAASFSDRGLASEAMTTAFGTNLAMETQTAQTFSLPTWLAGTSVSVHDSEGVERLAPLFFVSPTQVNYLMPRGTAAGSAEVIVRSGDGTISTGIIRIAAVAPGLFAANADGQGVAAAVAMRVKADGLASYESAAEFDAAIKRFVPRVVELGAETEETYLMLFGTGLRHFSSLSTVSVKIGGEEAEVLYAGPQGDFIGLDQVNVRVPRSLSGRGEVEVVVMVDGQVANTVKVTFR